MKETESGIAGIIIKIAAALILGAAICVLAFYFSGTNTGTGENKRTAKTAVFSEGTTINGVSVAGLTASEAEELIKETVGEYTLDIIVTSSGVSQSSAGEETAPAEDSSESEETASEETSSAETGTEEAAGQDETENAAEEGLSTVQYTISASDISLDIAEELSFEDLLSAQQEALEGLEDDASLSDEELSLETEILLTYDEDALSDIISDFSSQFETGETAVNATLSYDETEGAFVIVPETYGGDLSAETLLPLVKEAVNTLEPSLDFSSLIEVPAVTSGNSLLITALTTANSYLDVELTYTFTVNSGSVTITKDDILSWIYYDEDSATINIDNEELSAYVDTLASKYSVYSSTSKFKTVSGSYISVNVSSNGQTVDSDSLYNSIYDNLTNCISGTFAAVYSSTSADSTDGVVDFGGDYVEVNLTTQHLYVFVDGVQVMDCDIVSGKVSDGHRTPTGVYTVKSKETNRYLTGATYRSWVYFWMPFNGGIGFHDATWRSSFGGSIYLYSGSHGCINMPYAKAKALYSYISVGTYVVVYGGETSVEGKTQKVSVSSSFAKTEGDSSFNLNASTSGDGTLTYSSSNTDVVTVDSDGNVTVKGTGTATVTVTASNTGTYKEASAKTTITVSHNYKYVSSEWSSDYSSCKIKITCSGCNDTKTLTANVTSAVTKEATTSSEGTKTYTATATYDGQTFTDSAVQTIDKIQESTTPETEESTTEAGTSPAASESTESSTEEASEEESSSEEAAAESAETETTTADTTPTE